MMEFPSRLLGPGACHVVPFDFRLYFFLHYPLFTTKAKHYTGMVFALKVFKSLLLLLLAAAPVSSRSHGRVSNSQHT